MKCSYEPTGPFGAKSIGEIVINTPAPALAQAIANATGIWFKDLPITSEQIAMGVLEKETGKIKYIRKIYSETTCNQTQKLLQYWVTFRKICGGR